MTVEVSLVGSQEEVKEAIDRLTPEIDKLILK